MGLTKFYKLLVSIALSLLVILPACAEDGYEMWLRYLPSAKPVVTDYQQQIKSVVVEANTPTLTVAAAELQRGLNGLLGKPIGIAKKLS